MPDLPVYVYACGKCGARFDVRLTTSELDTARPRCPECNSPRTRRKIATSQIKVKRGPKLTRKQMETAVGMMERRLNEDSHDTHAS